jgi:beta-galactosidase
VNNLRFGVDYYPEHWTKERWAYDAKLMKEAGIELVRLAEFAWAKLEPSLGSFNFQWLDEAIDTMSSFGIKVVLGTPTPTPPIWLVEMHPDILPVDLDGKTMGFGGRHHDCQSNENYRTHIRRFVRVMAKHYGKNNNVVGWQIDNEFGNSHHKLCGCDSCKNAFHMWLEEKYISIDKLNEAWGTVFWSQTYSKFTQIPLPMPTPNSHNPGLLLDWKRFASDLIVDFQKVQIDILREECPDQFITHNFMGFFDKTDYFNLAKDLDFVSHDQYPLHFREGRDLTACPFRSAAALDLMRAAKQKNFWIMEQQSGPTGWEVIGATPRPGQLKLWTYQSVAHGADTVVYFRWRSCLFGTEEYWHGILPHSGEPGRRYYEIKKAIEELSPVMEEFKGYTPEAEVGIVYSYDQNWAFQIQPHHPELSYIKHVQAYYKAFYDVNVPVDFVAQHQDFSKYKLLIAPLLYLTTPELVKKLEEYVKAGGKLVLTMRTGVKDWNNSVIPKTLPGDFSELTGIKIEDYDCLRELRQSITWTEEQCKESGEVYKWCDIITLNGAKALAVYEEEFYKGTPAVTCNEYDGGLAYYVGTELGENMMKKLVSHLLDQSEVSSIISSPEGVEVCRRRVKDKDYIFILNHSSIEKEVSLPQSWNVIVGKEYINEHMLKLPAYETALFIRNK